MARLIRIRQEEEKRTVHKDCGAEIGYYLNELKEAIHYDYGGGSEVWYYIICPNCGKKVEVKNR